MVNFGPLVAEIGLPVWGTPANFNGFRVLAALLHSTLVVGISQTCGVEQRAPPIFGRAAITLGIGAHSSFKVILAIIYPAKVFLSSLKMIRAMSTYDSSASFYLQSLLVFV